MHFTRSSHREKRTAGSFTIEKNYEIRNGFKQCHARRRHPLIVPRAHVAYLRKTGWFVRVVWEHYLGR